jgi:competence protein ComGC
MNSPSIDYSKYIDFRMNELEKLKCGLMNFKMIGMILVFLLLCSCLLLLIPDTTTSSNQGYRQRKKCGCAKCMGKMVVEGFESSESKGEKGDLFNKVTMYTTRKFELLPESTMENAPKNLLFGEGEFIFGDKLYVFIMADLYTIGANLYTSTNKASDLFYSVFIGKVSTKGKDIKFKLGDLTRSQDGRYKLEFNSVSPEFNKMVADNNYIQVRLSDKQKTLNMVVLEGKY